MTPPYFFPRKGIRSENKGNLGYMLIILPVFTDYTKNVKFRFSVAEIKKI